MQTVLVRTKGVIVWIIHTSLLPILGLTALAYVGTTFDLFGFTFQMSHAVTVGCYYSVAGASFTLALRSAVEIGLGNRDKLNFVTTVVLLISAATYAGWAVTL